jgi:hypothetical protein
MGQHAYEYSKPLGGVHPAPPPSRPPELELDPELEPEDTPASELEPEDEPAPELEPLLDPDGPATGVGPLDEPPEAPELPEGTGLPGAPPSEEGVLGMPPLSSPSAGGTPPNPDTETDPLHEAMNIAATAAPTDRR